MQVVLVEAMIYAIQSINSNHSHNLLKKYRNVNGTNKLYHQLTLGYNIQGTCDDSAENMFYALDAFTQIELRMTNDTGNAKNRSGQCGGKGRFGALIGPSSTAGSASVSSLFRLKSIPVISYDATSAELGDHDRFPSFFRTIYSDDKQAEALVDLVERLGWNYISLVGSDDIVGRQGIYEFKRQLWNKTGYCVYKELYIGQSAMSVSKVVATLEAGRLRSNVTLLFMQWRQAVEFLRAAANSSLASTTFLGIDDWTSNVSMTLNVSGFLPSRFTDGLLATQIQHQIPLRYMSWISGYLQLRMSKDDWLYTYACQRCLRLLNKPLTDCSQKNESAAFVYSTECLNSIDIAVVILEQKRIANVISAVYTAAYALDQLYKNDTITIDNYGEYVINYSQLVEAIGNINVSHVPTLCDEYPPLRFDKNGNLEGAKFEIHNFYQGPKIPRHVHTRPGKCVPASQQGHTFWSHSRAGPANDSLVGSWTDDGSPLILNASRIHWKNGKKPLSSCSEPCRPGQITIYSPTECCWSCEPCPAGTWSNTTTECYPCGVNSHTTGNGSACVANHKTWVRPSDGLGIVNIALCLLGQTAVLISVAVFSFLKRRRAEFSDSQTLKAILHFNCAVCFCYFTFHSSFPTQFCCTMRRFTWQTGLTGHCVAAFFTTNVGRSLAAAALGRVGVATAASPHVAWVAFTSLGAALWLACAFLVPSDVLLVDLGPINGQWATSVADCNYHSDGLVMGVLVVYGGAFLLAALGIVFREERKRKRTHITDTTKRKPQRSDFRAARADKQARLHTKLILNCSYITVLVIGGLTPLFLTMEDPWSRSLTILMGGFVINVVVLGLYFVPRANRVIRDEWLGSDSRHGSFGGVYIVSAEGRSHRYSRSEEES